MLKRMMFGLMPTTMTRGIGVWCVLLLLALTASLVACAKPTSTIPSTPATFQIVELSINPAEVNSGEEVTITTKVTNNSNTEGSYNVELWINSIAELARKVTMPLGETQTLTFLVAKEMPGTYAVSLGELTKQFVVVKPAETTQCCYVTNPRVNGPQPNIPSCCAINSEPTESAPAIPSCCI